MKSKLATITAITPEDILRLAENNVILANCVECWRRGAFSWEESMMMAASYLAQQNAKLIETAVKIEMLRPREVFIPSDEEAESVKGT